MQNSCVNGMMPKPVVTITPTRPPAIMSIDDCIRMIKERIRSENGKIQFKTEIYAALVVLIMARRGRPMRRIEILEELRAMDCKYIARDRNKVLGRTLKLLMKANVISRDAR